jgi:hypothetical protein
MTGGSLQQHFLITIDTEGDDAWGWTAGKPVRTENARFLDRFQDLCEHYSFKPTYLTNYEMAIDPVFQAFGRRTLERGTAEIGMHLHAWNSPPLTGSREWDDFPIYATELTPDVLASKMEFLSELLTKTFGIQPVSHRGGRYGFDEQVLRVLEGLGYRADCSVTPGISWRGYTGMPSGSGGCDFTSFTVSPYFLDAQDIRREGSSPVLEVPVTICPNYPAWVREPVMRREDALFSRVVRKVAGPPFLWLRPLGGNVRAMTRVVDWSRRQSLPVLEFMLHSSELMPGGSPTFRDAQSVERLFSDMEALFQYVSGTGARGATLADYRALFDEQARG